LSGVVDLDDVLVIDASVELGFAGERVEVTVGPRRGQEALDDELSRGGVAGVCQKDLRVPTYRYAALDDVRPEVAVSAFLGV
jgi:hypothetical protein